MKNNNIGSLFLSNLTFNSASILSAKEYIYSDFDFIGMFGSEAKQPEREPLSCADRFSFFEWIPTIILYANEAPIGYMQLSLSISPITSEDQISISLAIDYMYLMEGYRDKSYYSDFAKFIIKQVIAEIGYLLESSEIEDKEFIFIADYASRKGNIIGDMILCEIDEFCYNNDLMLIENVSKFKE